MAYKYTAYNEKNEIVTGTIGVMDEVTAEMDLQNAGMNLINLEYIKPRATIEELIPSLFGVKNQDVIEFSSQLATLVESGISLIAALHLLEEQSPKSSFRKIMAGLRDEIQGGNSFSAALAKYGNVFPDIYCRIVAAGEKAGTLEVSLRQAVDYMQRGSSAMQKARRAMVYPAMLICVAVGVIILLLTVALPPLLTMFDELDISLPWTTRLLLALTGFFTDYVFHILGFLIILAISVTWYLKRPSGRMALDRILLRLPLLGQIVLKSNMALFSRTVSVLFAAGIPLPQILGIVKQTAGNRVIKQAIADVEEGLAQGRGISRPMALSGVFPQLMVQVVMVGEQTGTLDTNLANIADSYEEEVSRRTESVISMIEPTMIVIMGLVVGFIALSVIMPMYSMLGEIQ